MIFRARWRLRERCGFGLIVADFELRMRQVAQYINRRTRQRLYAATAVLALAMWLLITVAEACTPLHAWLHGGTIPDDDDCAIVAITHGKVETVACDIPVLVPVAWIEVTPRVEFPVFSKPVDNLRSGRAPPAHPVVS